jgi:mono/diheme cytochrome c family protein
MSMYRYAFIALCAAVGLTCGAETQAAETDAKPPMPAAQSSEGAAPKPQFSVKNTFRNICGFCHESYGRKAGKGPKLMGTELTDEQIFNRIKNGKPGRMAAFGGAFTDDQIRQIVTFIRALRPDVEP